jgi:hypothetical protein
LNDFERIGPPGVYCFATALQAVAWFLGLKAPSIGTALFLRGCGFFETILNGPPAGASIPA